MINLVYEFHQQYMDSVKMVNQFDQLSIKSVNSIDVQKHSYGIIKEQVHPIKQDFDTQQMGKAITALGTSVKNTISQLSRIKGEFFHVNSLIINKDTNNLKLEHV